MYTHRLPDVHRVLDENGNTPLHAVTAVDADVGLGLVDALLERGANPNVHGSYMMTPLHMAVCMGFSSVAQRLLRGGADPRVLDVDGRNAMHWACVKGNVLLARILREAAPEVAECKAVKGEVPMDPCAPRMKARMGK